MNSTKKHLAADWLGYIPANGFKPFILKGETWWKHVKAAISLFCWQTRDTLQALMAPHALFRYRTTWKSDTALCLVVAVSEKLSCGTFGFDTFVLKQVTLLVYSPHTKAVSAGSDSFDGSWLWDFEVMKKTPHHLMQTYANRNLFSFSLLVFSSSQMLLLWQDSHF